MDFHIIILSIPISHCIHLSNMYDIGQPTYCKRLQEKALSLGPCQWPGS